MHYTENCRDKLQDPAPRVAVLSRQPQTFAVDMLVLFILGH